MNSQSSIRPHNVAAWALKPKQRPLTVSNSTYSAPGRGHVAIRVFNVAINPIDHILQDSDLFGLKYPCILGIDVSGVIFDVGEDVSDFHVGQRVIAYASASLTLPCNGAEQTHADTATAIRQTLLMALSKSTP